MMDSDVQKKSGIYEHVLDGDEHHLGIRTFDEILTKCNTLYTLYYIKENNLWQRQQQQLLEHHKN